MIYYKDNTSGEVFAYDEDGSQDALILENELNENRVLMTAAEVDAFANPPATQEQKIFYFTEIVNGVILDELVKFNTANGTVFESVHNCESYSRVAGYTHQAFCASVWAWSVSVWEEARLIQADVLAGTIPEPTEAEFKAMLPAFAG